MEDDPARLNVLLERERTVKNICAELNNFTDLKPVLMTVLGHLKSLTGCQAVGVRLHDDGDYPYYVYDGFPESFIKTENSLCARDENGKRIPGPDGTGYLLECMCGNIIRGRFDPSLPFFTENGSFWANHTTGLLAETTEEERQSETRNVCNSSGYESVALVPVTARGERIGLMQFNDMSRDMFGEELIAFLEMIGEQVGLAVQNSLTHTKLKETLREVQVLRGMLPVCSHCKKIRDHAGQWHSIVTYVRDHSEASFTHTLCPTCKDELYGDLLSRPDR